MKKRIFSVPFNAAIGEKNVNEKFIPFLKDYKDIIYDVYFTCRVSPFDNDGMAMGQATSNLQYKEIFRFMMWMQEKFEVKASATFNNFTISPSYENMEIFIGNLKPLYDAGLRSVTIPHMHWGRLGAIKDAYPDLFIKNTVIRGAYDPQEYANYAEGGFDLVNIDCSTVRDRDNLIQLKRAYDKYKKPISLLVNEVCRGKCPVRDEHYAINCSLENMAPYFKQKIAEISCAKWRKEIPYFNLLIADMPYDRKSIDEYLEYVQILKLHGRSNVELFYDSLDIVKRYVDGNEIVLQKKYDRLRRYFYDKRKFELWCEYVKNCKFQCWDCIVCEGISKEGSGINA